MTKYINKTDAIAFLGDLAYDLNDENGQRGNNFMKFINNITLNIPFQLSPGNHENFNKYEEYQKRFYLPNRSLNKTFYYSYDVNDIHFVSLNVFILLFKLWLLNKKKSYQKFKECIHKDNFKISKVMCAYTSYCEYINKR